jgi:hypothetical protein
MRLLLLTVTGAGLGLSAFLASPPAAAITITTPAGVRPAVAELAIIEAVHCRRYRHWHEDGQGWSRGCGAGGQTGILRPSDSGRTVAPITLPKVGAPAPVGRPAGNYYNPSNPQDRSGSSNRQDMTQPRAFNPQDMR